MSTIQNIFPNHLLKSSHEIQHHILENIFSDLTSCNHKSYLSLYKYVNNQPEKYYSKDIFLDYYSFLKDEYRNNKQRLFNLLNQNIFNINKAFLFLDEINQNNWHDIIENLDEYDFIRFCDKTINTTYLKLIEGVYYPFIYLLAFISRINRNKNTDGLDVYNSVEELKFLNKSNYCTVYDNIIRNGIAHGGLTYKQKEITYIDKRSNSKSLTDIEIITLIDSLIDLCNALVLAAKLFYVMHLDNGLNIPQHLMIEELKSETEAPWWKIDGCLNSVTINNESQLIIYVRPNTRDYFKVQYSTFMTGVLCEQLSPGYDRYFISLHSKLSLPGWAVFDGNKLKNIRINKPNSFEDYKGVLIDNLLFYVPKIKLPRFLGRIDTLIKSFHLHIPFVFEIFHSKLGHLMVNVRNVSIHRNGWHLVLTGSVIINENSNNIKTALKLSPKRILRKTLKKAKKHEKNILLKIIPLGYARINVFNKDFRIRKLKNYGLGPNLIGTIQLQKIKRIKAPDIFGSKIEKVGRYRFAWNKAWLELTTE